MYNISQNNWIDTLYNHQTIELWYGWNEQQHFARGMYLPHRYESIYLKFHMSKDWSLNFRNMDFEPKEIKNGMTKGKFSHFWGSVKISQILFWSISSKYLTVLNLGSYLLCQICFQTIVRALFWNIWFKICTYCSSYKMLFEILKGAISLHSNYISPQNTHSFSMLIF